MENHFYEMKGDEGMSRHENKYTPRQKVINNPIPTSLFCSKAVAFYIWLCRGEKTVIKKSTLRTDIQMPKAEDGTTL